MSARKPVVKQPEKQKTSTATPTKKATKAKQAPLVEAQPAVTAVDDPLDSPLLLLVERAVAKLGICRDFMYRLLAGPHPRVRSVKVGRARRVPLRELEAYIEHLMDVA